MEGKKEAKEAKDSEKTTSGRSGDFYTEYGRSALIAALACSGAKSGRDEIIA